MHDDLHAGIARVLAAAQKSGKKSGIYCGSGAQAKKYIDQGFQMVSVGADTVAIPTYMAAELSTAQGGSKMEKGSGGPYGRL